MVINVAQGAQDNFIHPGAVGGEPFRVPEKLLEQQSHGELVQAAVRIIVVDGRPDQVFDQILHREQPGGVKLQRQRRGILLCQTVQKEVAHAVAFPQHSEGGVEKLRQHDDVDPNILLPRRKDLMAARLIEEE